MALPVAGAIVWPPLSCQHVKRSLLKPEAYYETFVVAAAQGKEVRHPCRRLSGLLRTLADLSERCADDRPHRCAARDTAIAEQCRYRFQW